MRMHAEENYYGPAGGRVRDFWVLCEASCRVVPKPNWRRPHHGNALRFEETLQVRAGPSRQQDGFVNGLPPEKSGVIGKLSYCHSNGAPLNPRLGFDEV